MAQTAVAPVEPHPPPGLSHTSFLLRKLFGRNHESASSPTELPRASDRGDSELETDPGPGPEPSVDDHSPSLSHLRRGRPVVPGLPRAQTFKRQQSEKRVNLAPVEPTPDERRAVSVDRRVHRARATSQPASQQRSFPRASAPELLDNNYELQSAPSVHDSLVGTRTDLSLSQILDDERTKLHATPSHDLDSVMDPHDAMSITTSQYDAMIHDELERQWILNLSMHFRDKSKREKFFVTYRENNLVWRRVTISLDYRNAPENSLELDLAATRYQRDKSARIYEAIRESLQDIQFYDTVTNLKLQTTDGRLHVHVVEDTNEIINYPTVRQIQHLGCRRIRESEIDFDAHMSGFVYRVRVCGETLIKKEIPGPETVDEFLYEINALHSLRDSQDVIRFYGVVVDDQDENVKGLLISYAEQGALVDVLFDNRQDSELGTPWPIRERWARQIVQGLADIHECGFVQGDFTLSNIVIDDQGDAKIIDINRRGCPIGWEPPEATTLIESGQRLSMYIGVKSDLYQLGMVLWALATQEDEPEVHGRPLRIEAELSVPEWYRTLAHTCLSNDPRQRLQASSLLTLFPKPKEPEHQIQDVPTSISVDDGYSRQEYFVESYDTNGQSGLKTVKPADDWSYLNLGNATNYPQDPYYYSRGRSPPSPLSSHFGPLDSLNKDERLSSWARGENMPHSYSDMSGDEISDAERFDDWTPTTNGEAVATPGASAVKLPTVLLETADGIVSVPTTNSGALTPESLAVEHHVYGIEADASTTTTPRPREVKAAGLMEAWLHHTEACVAADIPLPVSPPATNDNTQVEGDQRLALEPVPDDLPKLDDEIEVAAGMVTGGVLEEQPDRNDEQEGDKLEPHRPGDPAEDLGGQKELIDAGQHQQELAISPAEGCGQENQIYADQGHEAQVPPPALDSGFTAPEGVPDHSNGPPSDKTDSTTKPPKLEAEATGQPVDPVDGGDTATTSPVACESMQQVQVAPAEAVDEASVVHPELEGIGAAHSTPSSGEDAELRQKELTDDDFLGNTTTATATTSTTATTEGSDMTPAL